MTIHHSQIKKAEKAGYQLSEGEDGQVAALYPKRAIAIMGASAADAMAQMQACIAICGEGDIFRIRTDKEQPRLITVLDERDYNLKGCPMPPVAAHKALMNGAEWEQAESEEDPDAPDPTGADNSGSAEKATVIERINGVAIDGAVAFKEGTPAGDCPYSSEEPDPEDGDFSNSYEDFIRWNEEWDAAADEATDEDEGKGGSVVSEKYRAKYAEAGHPTHCGDWLAETLNEICLNKEGVNLELFEGICGLNGVDTSKYKREGVGWQGRIRMTGRNLISKKVFLNAGKLILPDSMGGFKQASEEWMAAQRFKAVKKET